MFQQTADLEHLIKSNRSVSRGGPVDIIIQFKPETNVFYEYEILVLLMLLAKRGTSESSEKQSTFSEPNSVSLSRTRHILMTSKY